MWQGPRSKFLSGGGEVLKKNVWAKCFFWGGGRGGRAWEFLFNFSKVTENAFITIKLLISGLKIHYH